MKDAENFKVVKYFRSWHAFFLILSMDLIQSGTIACRLVRV